MPRTRPPHPAKAMIVGRGYLLREAAEAVGVNAHTFGRILNGYGTPWPALRQRLAEFLEVPEDELFDLEAVDA